MLAHLEGLIALWMYSFIYQNDPEIHYDESLDARRWFKSYLEGQILDDYLMHLGGESELDQLRARGVQLQNIVALGKTEQYLDTRELPRRYIPIFSVEPKKRHWRHHHEDGKEEPNEKYKSGDQPSFVPADHLFGRPKSVTETKYAYKYPSTTGKCFAQLTNLRLQGFRTQKSHRMEETSQGST